MSAVKTPGFSITGHTDDAGTNYISKAEVVSWLYETAALPKQPPDAVALARLLADTLKGSKVLDV